MENACGTNLPARVELLCRVTDELFTASPMTDTSNTDERILRYLIETFSAPPSESQGNVEANESSVVSLSCTDSSWIQHQSTSASSVHGDPVQDSFGLSVASHMSDVGQVAGTSTDGVLMKNGLTSSQKEALPADSSYGSSVLGPSQQEASAADSSYGSSVLGPLHGFAVANRRLGAERTQDSLSSLALSCDTASGAEVQSLHWTLDSLPCILTVESLPSM